MATTEAPAPDRQQGAGTKALETAFHNHDTASWPMFDRGDAFDRLLAGHPTGTIKSLIKQQRGELDQLLAYREAFGFQVGQAPNLDAAIAWYDFLWCQLTLEAGARQSLVR